MKKKEKKQSEQNNEEIIPKDNSIEIERSEPEETESAENLSETETIDEDKHLDNELVERINELEDKNKELNDRLLRRAAEFENYKKRTENDQLNLLKYAGKDVILKVLSVYDDLQRSLVEDRRGPTGYLAQLGDRDRRAPRRKIGRRLPVHHSRCRVEDPVEHVDRTIARVQDEERIQLVAR